MSRSEGDFFAEDEDAVSGSIVFIGNAATLGGAIYMLGSDRLQVSWVTFQSNEAVAGGAIFTTDMEGQSSEFRECVFRGNKAVDGGALYFSTERAVEEVTSSVFVDNLAEFSGGAIFHTGFLRVFDTTFGANAAGSEGIAILSFGILEELSNVSFSENSFHCRHGEYGFIVKSGTEFCASCFDEVCARCAFNGHGFPAGQHDRVDGLPLCAPAPPGSTTYSSGATVSTLVINKGYYRTSNHSVVPLECHVKEACVGGDGTRSYCAPGYKGPYCAVCDDGFTPTFNYRCKKCPDRDSLSTMLLVAVVVFVILASGVVLSYLRRVPDGGAVNEAIIRPQTSWRRTMTSLHKAIDKGWPSSAIKITVIVWQIISQFAVIHGNIYTPRYATFISNISVVNVDFGYILSFACILRLNFYHRLIFATIGPFAVILVLGFAYGLTKRNDGLSERALRVVRHRFISAATFVMVFVYASVTFTLVQTFSCDLLDDETAYLRADYSIICSTTLYNIYWAYATVMVGIYTFGIPAFFLWFLLRNRRDLKSRNRENMEHLQPFSNIWIAYTPSRYYYEVVECGRRIFYAVSAILGSFDSRVQAVMILLNTVVPLLLDALHPFDSGVDMVLYRWGNSIVLGSVFMALVSRSDDEHGGSLVIVALSDALLFANLGMVATVVGQGVFIVMRSRETHKVTVIDLPVRNPSI